MQPVSRPLTAEVVRGHLDLQCLSTQHELCIIIAAHWPLWISARLGYNTPSMLVIISASLQPCLDCLSQACPGWRWKSLDIDRLHKGCLEVLPNMLFLVQGPSSMMEALPRSWMQHDIIYSQEGRRDWSAPSHWVSFDKCSTSVGGIHQGLWHFYTNVPFSVG